jgi:heme-degrading monooxygenase HmoA
VTIARIWTTGLAPGREKEFEDFARASSLPMFRAQRGYQGVLILRHETVAQVVTLWKSLDDVDALNQSESYQDVVARIKATGFLVGTQAVRIDQLLLADLAGEGLSE